MANQAQQNTPQSSDNPIDAAIKDGKRLRDSGHAAEAIVMLSKAVAFAHNKNDLLAETRCLIVLGSAQFINFQYRAALESLERAASQADQLKDARLAGAASGNIATVYLQVGDMAAAEAQSERAIGLFRTLPKDDQSQSLLARALQVHASICFELQKNREGDKDSAEAIALVPKADLKLRAFIWDIRGTALLREQNTAAANAAFHEAYSLNEKIHNEDGLAGVKEHLAELELQKVHPDWRTALRLIDEAFAAQSVSFKTSPQYYPIYIRARILLESGNKPAALAEFLRAVDSADQWRAGALPGDTSNTQTVATLQEVYAAYAQLAAAMALETGDNNLAVKALEVLAENRSASLREQLRRVYASNFRMPDEYYFKLSQLQSAQAEVTLGRNAGEDKASLDRIRLEVSALENKIGLNPEKFPGNRERIPRRNSLRDIQSKMGRDQVLISITLGKSRSYLWAVTHQTVHLSQLAGEGDLTSQADLFAATVRNGDFSTSSATPFSRALFAGLPPDTWNRSEWMIVADGTLLNGIPFCALTNIRSNRRLIDTINLRFLPSELLLLDRPPARADGEALSKSFVGIGDPIYNLADSRLVPNVSADAKTMSDSIALARLPGSEKEIRSAAKESHSSSAILLSGARATRKDLTSALAQAPDVVHFAVHVVSPLDQPQQAALALSLKNGIPELLTPEVIASFHTPGSLVVLSGCSSGKGKVLPGAGLVGLSRAWLLAGAAAVVVSSWPTPDDSGRFFSSFYGHFDQILSGDTAQRAALALRQTQIDMQNGSGYQTSSSFWGAFAVISKE